jgi:hypothetical protein
VELLVNPSINATDQRDQPLVAFDFPRKPLPRLRETEKFRSVIERASLFRDVYTLPSVDAACF